LLVDNSFVGIGVSQNQAVVFCNQRFAEVFGYSSPREVVGLHLGQDRGPESLEFVASIVSPRPVKRKENDPIRDEGPQAGRVRLRRRGFRGIIDYEGKPASQGMVIDVTERKSVEAAVRGSEEKYRALLDSINGIFFSVNSEGVITFVSGESRTY